jgi:hypothetical protein
LSWTWKLARASRETQYRAATAASPAIRDLLRTLASSRGEEHHVRARLLVASLRQADLPVTAAALAAALTHDAIAGRTIDLARDELGTDVEVLAAAFASNLPEQKADPPAKARRPRKKRKDRPAGAKAAGGSNGSHKATASAEDAAAGVAEAATGGETGARAVPDGSPDGTPGRKRRRRRRRRKGGGEPGQGAQANGGQPSADARQANGDRRTDGAPEVAGAPQPGGSPQGDAAGGANGNEARAASAERAQKPRAATAKKPREGAAPTSRATPRKRGGAAGTPADSGQPPAANGAEPVATAAPRVRRRRSRAVMDAASIGLQPKGDEHEPSVGNERDA